MRQLRSAWFVVLTPLLVWSAMVGRSVEVDKQEAEARLSEAKAELDSLHYENAILTHQHTRLSEIVQYSTEYRIDAGVATLIYDIALSEGISSAVAFKLVYIESAFDSRAVSRAGAIGYAQVMPSTAADLLGRRVSVSELFDPELNLHLGFSYLRRLLVEYNGDLRLALLSYNRGPRRVNELLAMGQDPANGYARSICGECLTE